MVVRADFHAAQIRGYRGATEREDDLRERLQADLEYLSGGSIWRALDIIFATFRVLGPRTPSGR